MQITYVSTQRGWGGGEHLLAQLIQGMTALGVRPTLAAPQGSEIAQWARDWAAKSNQQQAAGEPIRLIELAGRGRSPRAMFDLRRAVAGSADLVLLNDPHAITYGGLATVGLGVPRLGIRHTSFPVRSGWKHNRLLERIVCVSQAAVDECLKAGVDRSKLDLIYAGLADPQRNPEQIEAVRRRFRAVDALHVQAETNSSPKHLLALGSLLPVKGFDTLIESVARGAAQGGQWHLWIAGEGPERETLLALAKERGIADRVHLLGFRKDIGALLEGADLFVSTSHREGLSLVLIEAMRVGCPVVSTPAGGNREAMRADLPTGSDVGIVCQAGDAVGTCEAIQLALANPAITAERVEKAKQWSAERYSVERMARDYLNVAQSLCPQSTRRQAA